MLSLQVELSSLPTGFVTVPTAMIRSKLSIIFDIGNIFLYADNNIIFNNLNKKCNISLKKARKFFILPEYKLFSEGKITEDEFTKAL